MKFYGYKNFSSSVHRWKVQVFPTPKEYIIISPVGNSKGGVPLFS